MTLQGRDAQKQRIKIAVILLISVGTVFLGGCTVKNFFKKEEDKMDEKMQQIISVISNKDAKALQKFFSKTAVEEAEDFEEGCDYIFSEYRGDFQSAERIRYSSKTHYDSGKHAREIDSEYEITTSEDSYLLYINDWQSNTIDSDKEGLYSLKMVTLEIRDNTENFDPGSRNKRAGVYSPIWDK